MTGERGTLPPGWEWTTIGQVAETTSGGTPSRKQASHFGGAIPWVKSAELRDGYITAVEEFITDEGLRNSNAKMLPKGTALVALYGATVGRTGILGLDAATNQAVCAIFPRDNSFTAEYITYWLRSQRQRLIDLSVGGAQPNISQGIVRSFPLPLAPLPEQRRIVAEIKKQFTRLDAGVAALKRVQANLKRYRASVLKAACEGQLAPQDPNDEPADRMLARILAERRTKWEAEHPGKRYVEPAAPETDGLAESPAGWCWATVEQLGEIIGGLTKNQKRDALPIRLPYLRVANVYANELRLDDLQTIGVEKSESGRVLLEDGDLLVVEGNGSADQIGRVAIWRGAVSPCIHQNHIIKVRFNPVSLGPFILYWLLSDGGRAQITQVASSTSGLYTLSLSKVASLLIPLPPLPEQRRIVAEVEWRLSVVAELEATVAANLARAGRLRQAVLKRAFEGRLLSSTQ